MKKYDSYKPSGIDWIGEIPSHWDVQRMRYLCDIITGDKDTINRVEDGAYPFYVRSPQIERINSYSFDGEAVLMAGDGVGAGKVLHYANGKFDFHQRVYNIHNFKNIKGKLLFLYLKSLFKYKIEEGGAKNTVDSVRQPWLKDFPVCIPPLEEQEAIASWLDKKCGEIDAAIAKVDREIELIEELKQSEISRVVTRGLNPNVPLRPSGIDWIGDIPEHWSSMKLKHTVKNVETDFMDGDWIESTDISTEGIRYLTSGNVGPGYYKEQGEGFISEETFKALDCIEVFPGDLLISRLNEPIARTCFVPNLGFRIVTCVDNVIYRPKSEILDKRFIMYQLNSKPFWFNASQLSSGATMQRISRSKLGAINIIVPPLPEQQAIADYLDKKCAEIDGLKAKLTKKRETLKELRQSIISEVVTGKRKVI